MSKTKISHANKLHAVFCTILFPVLSRLCVASLERFSIAELINEINNFLRRRGHNSPLKLLPDVHCDSDKLFTSMPSTTHRAYRLTVKVLSMKLRSSHCMCLLSHTVIVIVQAPFVL